MSNKPKENFWLMPNGLAALGLIGAVLFFLLSEHRAHVIYVLPYLILLLCPLMHMFMHRGHNGHGAHLDSNGKNKNRSAPKTIDSAQTKPVRVDEYQTDLSPNRDRP